MTEMAMLFPGQGSQHVGMGKSLYESSAVARACFEQAEDILGMDMKKLCFYSSLSELSRVDHMQIAMLTVCVAAYSVYMDEIGQLPSYAAGHSLGEYSALTCAGALRFEDALRIVKLRGELALEVTNQDIGYMMVVQDAKEELLLQLCTECSNGWDIVAPACLNSPRQTVVAGSHIALSKLEEELWKHNIIITPMFNSAPFHTPLLGDAAKILSEALAACSMGQFLFPVFSGVTGTLYSSESKLATTLSQQLVQPVQWRKILDAMESRKVSVAIEMGPQSILSALVKENGKSFTALSFSAYDDRQRIAEWYGQSRSSEPVMGPKYHFIELCLGIAMSTKNRNDNLKEYEQGVMQPYEQLEGLADELEESGEAPTVLQMRTALKLLGLIMDTKKVPPIECDYYYKNLLNDTGTESILKEAIHV